MSLKKQGKYRFDDFEVDLAQRTLRRQGHLIAVSSRTFDLLVYLVLNSQRIVTQDEIMGALWPETHLEESNLGQHIFLLRKALTSKQPGEKLILRKPGPGYEFTASVTKIDLESSEIASKHIHHLPAGNSRIHESLEIPLREPGFFSSRASRAARDPDFSESEEKPSRSGRSAERRAAVLERRESEDEKQHETELILEPEEYENSGERNRSSSFGKALRRLKPWQIAATAILILASGAGAWFSWSYLGRPHPDSLSIVVGSLKNTSGEPQFDQALETALTLDLQQSPYLIVASSQRFLQTATELNLPPESLSDAASAAKVCKDLNNQAYVSSTIERFALKYLLTVEAFDCASGHGLARSKALVGSPDAVLSVLDKVAADLRSQLGEPSSSIAKFGKFNKPLFANGTASLGAIKAYAEASRRASQNKLQDAIPLYQQALRLDPKLTMVTADLGAAYSNLGQHDLAATTLTQAYEARDSVDEPIRFFITATYNRIVTGDLQAGIRNEKEWSQEYPHNPAPLGDLADLETQIGKPSLALDPARQALVLNPNDGLSYILLARAQMHLGQIDEAEKTCNLAISHRVDDTQIHAFLFEIAYLRLDQPAMDEQIAWAKGKPAEPAMRLELARMDLAMGKVKAAMAILNSIAAEDKDQGDEARASQILAFAPRAQAELGNLESALGLLTAPLTTGRLNEHSSRLCRGRRNRPRLAHARAATGSPSFRHPPAAI